MPEAILTLNVPQTLWDALEKLAKAQECSTNQVAVDALEYYLSDLMTGSTAIARRRESKCDKAPFEKQNQA